MSRTPVAAEGTDNSVRTLVESRFDFRVTSLKQMTYGHGSVTYRVETDVRPVIVRTNVDADIFVGSVANIATLKDLGLPVPNVLATDITKGEYPFAYVITDVFAGRDLRFEITSMNRSQMTMLAEQVVSFERLAMSLPEGRRYGFAPIGIPAKHDSWPDVINADRERVRFPNDPELDQLTAQTYDLLDQCRVRLSAIRPTCFLDDLTTKNVMVHKGVLQGVVDFDGVCYGDPMYWLSLVQVAMTSDVGEQGQFYLDELFRFYSPSDEEQANCALYSAIHTVVFMTWDADNLDRRARMLEKMKQWLEIAS